MHNAKKGDAAWFIEILTFYTEKNYLRKEMEIL